MMKPGGKWINCGWRYGAARARSDAGNQSSLFIHPGVENQTLAVFRYAVRRGPHSMITLRLAITVLLFDVPVMTPLMENEARRFIALVDEFTSATLLVVSAAAPLYEILSGKAGSA